MSFKRVSLISCVVLIVLALSFTTGCKDKTELATVKTVDVSDITAISAKVSGNVTDDGGASILSRGICWSKISSEPTLGDGFIPTESGTGEFSCEIIALLPDTKYYVRAYATNSEGTSYGNAMEFTTNKLSVEGNIPALTTSSISQVSTTKAVCGGEITNNGDLKILARGICWSKNPEPTISNLDFVAIGDSTQNPFTCELKLLQPNTKYYVRAYATNLKGTGYGNTVEFTTNSENPESLPVLSTKNITDITTNSAKSGGNVTDDRGSTIIARGVCWSTNENPTINDNKTENGDGAGEFNSNITGLNPETKYYVRAYATNSAGTGYGSAMTFTTETLSSLPVLTTNSITDITINSAKSGGNISDDGGSVILARGVCWSINNNPTINDNKTEDGDGAGGFNSEITGLDPDTKYYVRAYATNSAGTGYGSVMTFTTEDVPSDLLTEWSNDILITLSMQTAYASYMGTRVDIFESEVIGVKTRNNTTVGTIIEKTPTCEGFVVVTNISNITNYSQLESLYNSGTVVSELELPIDYFAKNFSERYFISKIGTEYKLIHYKNGFNAITPTPDNSTGCILIFEYKGKAAK